MDEIDRALVNVLQDGIEPCERPFTGIAATLGIGENELLARLQALMEKGVLTRFGPMYNADRLGGAFTLAALAVPPRDFECVAGQVNAYAEVAHNYQREHELNMWFVIATENPARIDEVIAGIEGETGCDVVNLPKLEEYFVGLRFEAS